MKISVAQTHIIWENKKENIDKAEKLIARAQRNRASLILFPEMSFTGFSMNTSITKEKDNETIGKMCKLSTDYQISIGFGWVKDLGLLAENHYSVVGADGNIISDYCKIHPFSYSGEDKYFSGGDKVTLFVLDNLFFSNFICYDLRFPELFQAVSERADVIIVPANWPGTRANHWKTLLKARAIENQAYIIGVNCVGNIGGIEYSGGSAVIDPNGSELLLCNNDEQLAFVDICDDTRTVRDSFPIKRDRRVELYRKLYEATDKLIMD